MATTPAETRATAFRPVRGTELRCVTGTDERRRRVREQPGVNGIDYVEVEGDRVTVRVVFLSADGVDGLTAGQIAFDGGVRVTGIRAVDVSADGETLTVTCSQPGDASTYTLRLRRSDVDDRVPDGFDPRLATVDFSFRAGCPDPFDCRHVEGCPPPESALPDLDYLAKDYDSFRQLMLDRMAVLAPEWEQRNPADVVVTLVELLAAVADDLSYFQDAVATEAYLESARLRRSVRRHARLLDYRVHDGCNARAWVRFTLDATVAPGAAIDLPAGTAVLSGGDPSVPAAVGQDALDAADDEVFLTLHDATLRPRHDRIGFYTWDGRRCCLPAGATSATLEAEIPALDDRPAVPVTLARGEFLLLEEIAGPGTGKTADADPAHRHVVRLESVEAETDPVTGKAVLEVTWPAADALPFPLCVSEEVVLADGSRSVEPIAVARAGLALADHGRPAAPATLVPSRTPPERPYRPRVAETGVTHAHPYDAGAPAAALVARDARAAVPAVRLDIGERTWSPAPRGDLVGRDRFASEFVVEVERDGHAWLRFGDGVHGRRPPPGTAVTARARFGTGRAGNVGRDTLRHVAADVPVEAVTNPLPAAGGTDPEPIERVRRDAPEAFRVQERAVTPQDYARMAERHPRVQRATAWLRWTGSWHTVLVSVDPLGGFEVDDALAHDVATHLEPYRMAGHDLRVVPPRFAALDVRLRVCVAPDAVALDVERTLLEALSSRVLSDGRKGLFHPDRFTFGQPLYASALYAAATAVDGVRWVEATRLARADAPSTDETVHGALRPHDREILRLDNDPNHPEHGRLTLELVGGL